MVRKSLHADPDRHTRTDALRTNLKGRTARSGVITVSAHALLLALRIGAAMVLARLLTPADFGLLAMVTSLTAFIGSFRDFGLPMATVHQVTVSHDQVSGLFWVNLKLNGLIVLLMALMAPVLAWFYGESRLIAITLVQAVGMFCVGLAVQPESLLMRQMRFGVLMGIEVGSMLAGVVVGIGVAVLQASYWALVWQFLTMSLTKSLAIWLVCGWRPARNGRHGGERTLGLQSLLAYAGHYTGSRVLTHIGRNLDQVFVGYFGGAAAAGLYDTAYRWSLLPVYQIYLPLLNVAVAGLSRVQQDPELYRAYCRKGLLPVFAIPMPVLAFLFVEAREVMLVLLGAQWLEVVPLFQVLIIAAFVGSMSMVTKWLYLSQGHTKRQLQWGLVSTPVMVAAITIGTWWGTLGVAVGFTAGTCLLAYPSIAFCLKTSHLRMRDFFGVVWRPALASMAAAAALLVSRSVLPNGGSLLVELPLKLTVFGLAYLLVWVSLPGGWQASTDVIRLMAALQARI